MAKRITVLTTILIFAFTISNAQNINVKSFRILPNDQTARVHEPVIDQNGEKSALIKVVTNQKGFVWEGGTLGINKVESKTGEYWVYIPRGAKKITIKHDKLGVLRDYLYPEAIKKATVYEMVLTTAELETVVKEESIKSQWLIISSQPNGADVYIDDIHKGQTPLQIEMNTGSYSYRIEKPLYHPKAGRVELTITEKSTINETLNPNFGYLKIATQPESGAEVTINGNRQSSKTPLTTGKLISGPYEVTVSKPLYYTEKREVIVRDGQTTDVIVHLRPNFGLISVNTQPEAGAEVLVNSRITGKRTPCELDRLATGQHQITVRKEWYQPKTVAIDITDGYSDNITIDMQPTFGTLNVHAEHQADIYINDQYRAKGSWNGRLIAGWYTVEARKDKYHTDQKRIEINLGEEHNLSLQPKTKTGVLKIHTTPYNADIKLNGVAQGKTPATLRNLLIGSYEVQLSLKDYAIHNQSISIVENETAEIDVNLSKNIPIKITSSPTGATIIVDGQTLGVTPSSVNLPIGKKTITLKKQPDYHEYTGTIKITNDNKSFSFDLKPDKNSISNQKELINKIYSKRGIEQGLGAEKGFGTAELIFIDGTYAIVTPALLGELLSFSKSPKPGESLNTFFTGFGLLNNAIIAPEKSLAYDFISLNFGYVASSRNHRFRFIWKTKFSITYQFPLKNPSKEIVRRKLNGPDDEIRVGLNFIPFTTSVNLEFYTGGRSFFFLTAGSLWANKKDWYLKAEVDQYDEDGGIKPSPVTGSEVANLKSPYFEGFVPYFGLGIRF